MPEDHLAQGTKDDGDKVRMDLIPPEVMFAYASVLTFGVKKYAARNWEKGMTFGRLFAAMMRHMWAWWGGQGPTSTNFAFSDTDSETEYSHLWHAQFCLGCLIAFEERGMYQWDDRLGSQACVLIQKE